MTNHLNNVLPFEVLEKIFQNLNSKKDIKTCLSVCKSWQVAANEFSGEMSIEVYEDSLEDLSKEIVYFAQKVKSITLRGGRVSTTSSDRAVTCVIWFDIILACPNLVSIIIKVKNDSKYAKCLMDNTTAGVGRIQYFETSTPFFHLYLNLDYCSTITSLLVKSSLGCFGNEYRRDEGLVPLISDFPRLTSVEIKGPCVERNGYYKYSRPSAVDIIELLKTSPQLQKIRIYQLYEIKSDSLKVISDNTCLTSLYLKVEKMDLSLLKFITSYLKKLDYLYLNIKDLTMDAAHEEFEEEEFEDEEFENEVVLGYLNSFTTGISEFDINCVYECWRYVLKNGKEPCMSIASPYRDDHSYKTYYDEEEDDRFYYSSDEIDRYMDIIRNAYKT